MSDPLTVLPGEADVLRLFALDMPAEQARFLNQPGAVAQMLGVAELDPAQVDIVNTADLTDIGLTGYLVDGFAISPDQLDLPALTAITGFVLLIRSRAFGGRATTLKPAPQLSLIATLRETPTNWSPSPMHTASARPRLSPRAARSQARRIGFALFSVIMLLLGALVILVAK